MSESNQFEIVLTFKAVMDGLNRFVNGYKARMEEVREFNEKLRQGGEVLQRTFELVGAALSVAELAKYAQEAAEADKVQKQLTQTLQRVGETGAREALNAQAEALQKVTYNSIATISTVQRLLISFGLSAKQSEDLTEHVLDFAQETNQSAESAALLVGRTLGGQTDELGRYKITLDSAKGKVDALREALEKFAGGAARGAIADPVARENAARLSDATERLGRAVNKVVVPAFAQLVPLVETASRALVAIGNALAPASSSIGELVRSIAYAVGGFYLFKGAISAVLFLIAPLRAAFVLLAGQSLVELSSILAVCTAEMSTFGAAMFVLRDGLATWAGAGRGAAIGISLVGAAFAGWELGKIINEIQISGVAIKDWVAIGIVWIGDKFNAVWINLREQFEVTKASAEAFWDSMKLTTIGGTIAVLEAWNKLPFGQKLKADLSPLRTEFDRTAQHLLGTVDRLNGSLNTLEAERAAKAKENAELMAFIEEGARVDAKKPAGVPPRAGGGGAGGPRPDLNATGFGPDQEKLFQLQTQLLEAQVKGNQAEVDRLTDLLQQIKLKQELVGLEGKADPLIKARIAAEVAGREKARRQAADEVTFQQALSALEIQRANIDSDRLLSDQEKHARINQLLAEENVLLDAKIAKDAELLKAGVTDEEKARLIQEVAQLRQQLAANQRTQLGTAELSPGQGAVQGAKAFISSIGTSADVVANGLEQGLNSALQSTTDFLTNIVTHAQTFKQAWNSAILQVGQNFAKMAIEMVTKLIWRSTVERGLTALSVATHVGGEATKTAATAAGSGTRILLTIKEALASVYHGAVAAFEAMASIPYVGPILGAAALAAALGLGLGLVSKIGHADGGVIRGPGGPRDDRIPAMLSNGEGVLQASAMGKFGEPFFESLNHGIIDMSLLPQNIAAQIPQRGGGSGSSGAGAASSARPHQVAIIDHRDHGALESLQRDPNYDTHFITMMKKHRRVLGVKTS